MTYQADPEEINLVNMALHLRRPLLVTGRPGVGKSTLAYSIAHELKLGPVLRWPITSRSTLLEGQYHYDAIGRLQDVGLHRDKVLSGHDGPGEPVEPPDIGPYLRLGPLGTALLPWRRPRVLLVDEIDKSDLDLPNDLLNIFEEGEFLVPELARLAQDSATVMTADPGHWAELRNGQVSCTEFPSSCSPAMVNETSRRRSCGAVYVWRSRRPTRTSSRTWWPRTFPPATRESSPSGGV